MYVGVVAQADFNGFCILIAAGETVNSRFGVFECDSRGLFTGRLSGCGFFGLGRGGLALTGEQQYGSCRSGGGNGDKPFFIVKTSVNII